MRKALIVLLVMGVAAAAFQAPGLAKKRKKPVATTLYFHGVSPLGEQDSVTGLTDLTTFMTMDTSEPTESQSKSKSLGWSNTNCAGNRLFVTWVGNVSGKVVGDMKVTFTTTSIPQEVDIRVWPDVSEQLCDAKYPTPAAQVTVALPAGQGVVEAVIPKVNFTAEAKLMIQISPTPVGTDTPGPGRVFYDSTADPSRVEFTCLPRSGASCA